VPYRDPRTILTQRRDALLDERRALEERRQCLHAELDEIDRKLTEARKQRLPLLSRVKIATPCSANWDDMIGDERVRFCGGCAKNVYNLSALSGDEAEALLYEREGRFCAHFFRRKDGTILTRDCPTGVQSRRRRRALVGVGVAAASASALLAADALTERPLGLADTSVDRSAWPQTGGMEPIPVEEMVPRPPDAPKLRAGRARSGQEIEDDYLMGDIDFEFPEPETPEPSNAPPNGATR
jgi:hypothetical protein